MTTTTYKKTAADLAQKHIDAAKKETSLTKKLLLLLGAGIIIAASLYLTPSCTHINRIDRNADGSYSYTSPDFTITIQKGK